MTTPLATGTGAGAGLIARWMSLLAFTFCRRGVRLNDRRLMIRRQIGEGGFSFVYLVEDVGTGERFALKRVILQTAEQVRRPATTTHTGPACDLAPRVPQARAAQWEIDVHSTFRHRNLMPLVDSHVRPSGSVQEALMLFPLITRGSVEDILNRYRGSGASTFFTEAQALRIFAQVCEGLLQFHRHKPALAHRDIKPGASAAPLSAARARARACGRSVAHGAGAQCRQHFAAGGRHAGAHGPCRRGGDATARHVSD